MKTFSVTTETITNTHAFVMEHDTMEGALALLRKLKLHCISITEVFNYTGRIRDPKDF